MCKCNHGKRHRAAALQDASATAYVQLIPRGLDAPKAFGALSSVRWQADLFELALSPSSPPFCSPRRLNVLKLLSPESARCKARCVPPENETIPHADFAVMRSGPEMWAYQFAALRDLPALRQARRQQREWH